MITTLDEINARNMKFAYGNCNAFNYLVDLGAIPVKGRVLRTIGDLVRVRSMEYPGKAEMRAAGKFPTYAEFEQLGFKYKVTD